MSAPQEFNEAKEFWLQHNGNVLVTNTYLKVALLALCLLSGLLTAALMAAHRQLAHMKPMVIRINDVGKAEVIRYDRLDYKPRELEIKYFLAHFTRLYYGRNRYTLYDNFGQALYFLDVTLGRSIVDEFKKTKVLETYWQNPEDIEVEVRQITIDELQKLPYKARVEYTLIQHAPSDGSVVKKTYFTAQFVFLFKDKVQNEEIQINPLGLAITYFRSDQAFIKDAGGQ